MHLRMQNLKNKTEFVEIESLRVAMLLKNKNKFTPPPHF